MLAFMRFICGMLLIIVPALADWVEQYRTGEDLLQEGQPGSAIQQLRSALAQRPGHPVILDALGRAEFRAGRYRTAREYFDKASRVAGNDRAAVLSNSAMASIALGDSRRAESRVREALALEPRNTTVLNVLAQALYLQKRYGEAKTILETILSIRSDPATRSDLATVHYREGNNITAIDMLQEAVAETASGQARARLLANLGVMQWESGMREASEKSLRDALGEAEAAAGPHHPDTARILEHFSEVLRRTGRKAEAKKVADRAVAVRAASVYQTNENGFTVDWRDRRHE